MESQLLTSIFHNDFNKQEFTSLETVLNRVLWSISLESLPSLNLPMKNNFGLPHNNIEIVFFLQEKISKLFLSF